MDMIQDYLDLVVYQKSYSTALFVHEMTKAFPKEEIYGITGQIRRAVLSIPLNIAEGYGKRESVAEFKRFLAMSKGSCNEVKVLLQFSKDLGYIDDDRCKKLIADYNEIGKMLHGLMTNWKQYGKG